MKSLSDPSGPCGKLIPYCFLGAGHYCITNVVLLPSSLIALILGISYGRRIKNAVVPEGCFQSRWMYSTVFYGFALMMTTAGILHCFIHDKAMPGEPSWLPAIRLWFSIQDLGTTSNIAVSFFYAGLADLHLIDPLSKNVKRIFWGTWIAVYALWVLAIFGILPHGFVIMYLGVVGIGCGTYAICQVIFFVFYHPGSLTPMAKKYLFYAVIAGGVGYFPITETGGAIVCKILGPNVSLFIGGMVMWFYLSDVSMIYLGKFIMATKNDRTKDETESVEDTPSPQVPIQIPQSHIIMAEVVPESQV